MPWTESDVDQHKAGLSDKQKRQWVAVANAALAKCEREDGEDCEASAIRQANAAVGEAKGDAAEVVQRFDRGTVASGTVVRTDEGYLEADAVISRAGVFRYTLSDGTVRRELRPPDEVFAPDALASFQMVPMTNGHPGPREDDGLALVNAQNSKRLAVGWTGERVRQDGLFLRARLRLTDASAIRAVENGRRELSCGYTARLDMTPGTFMGEPYDAIQREIRGNHLAIVDVARAGREAALRLDGEQVTEEASMSDRKMTTVKVDGLDYEAAPEVANALAKAQARLDSLAADLKTKADEADATKAKLDSATTELETLKKQDRSAEIREAVKARVALERVAARVLPADTKLDEMDDAAIRRAVILAKEPTAKLDDKSEVYVQARFDSVVERLPERDTKAIADQRERTTPRGDAQPADSSTARQRMIEESRNAWKKLPGKAA